MKWEHVGPERPPARDVPPPSIGNYSYALVFDGKQVVYVHAENYASRASGHGTGRCGPRAARARRRRARASGTAQLAAAFDAYQQTVKVQEPNLASKLGGAPMWLQGAEIATGFVAQLDVDHLSLKAWPDAEVAGCVYVFAKGKQLFALWQYT